MEAGQVIEPPALIVICRVTIPTVPVVGMFVKVMVAAVETEIVLYACVFQSMALVVAPAV
jgi:hypothetical protein